MALHPVREQILQGRLCAHLRTKGMFVPHSDDAMPEIPYLPDTACFWCCRTGWAMGPDDLPADRERCARRDRGCFEGGGAEV